MNNQPNNNEKKCDNCKWDGKMFDLKNGDIITVKADGSCAVCGRFRDQWNPPPKEGEEINYLQVGQKIFCGHCDERFKEGAKELERLNIPCDCKCHSVSSAEDEIKAIVFHNWKMGDEIGLYEDIISHRKAEYTSLIEEVDKMRLYAETEISSTTFGNIQNTLLRQHVESHNQALDEVIKLIQEKL